MGQTLSFKQNFSRKTTISLFGKQVSWMSKVTAQSIFGSGMSCKILERHAIYRLVGGPYREIFFGCTDRGHRPVHSRFWLYTERSMSVKASFTQPNVSGSARVKLARHGTKRTKVRLG